MHLIGILFLGNETVLIMDEPSPKPTFTAAQAQGWSLDLRTVANRINHYNHKLAGYFYDVHYAIGPDQQFSGDPFELDEEYLRLMREQTNNPNYNIIEGLKVVLNNGNLVDEYIWSHGLKDYLEALLAKLEAEQN